MDTNKDNYYLIQALHGTGKYYSKIGSSRRNCLVYIGSWIVYCHFLHMYDLLWDFFESYGCVCGGNSKCLLLTRWAFVDFGVGAGVERRKNDFCLLEPFVRLTQLSHTHRLHSWSALFMSNVLQWDSNIAISRSSSNKKPNHKCPMISSMMKMIKVTR